MIFIGHVLSYRQHHQPASAVCRRTLRGFTLVEMMIAVAIVALLATIAIPSYRQYVRRQALSQGVAALTELQVRMESYYQNTGAYGSAAACGIAPGNVSNFSVTCTTSAGTGATPAVAQGYTAVATGTAALVADVTYSVDAQGNKTTRYTGGATAACWQVSGREC